MSPPTPTTSAVLPHAGRAARKTYANVPTQSPEFDRLEPSMEDRGGGEPAGPYSYDESAEEAARYQLPAPRPRPASDTARTVVGVGGGFPFKSAIAVGVVLILAGAAIVWGPKLVSAVRGMLTSSTPQVEAPQDASVAPRPKIADRVGQPSSSDQIAPVAQRVVLYDEDPAEPKGKQYVQRGSTNRRAPAISRQPTSTFPTEVQMTVSFRRNTDTSLPASHRGIDLHPAVGFRRRRRHNVPGIW